MYYRGSLGAILMFDLTKPSSFEHLPIWINEIREILGNEISILVVGNKSDLVSNRRVAIDSINNLLKKYNISMYFEISVKFGTNIDKAFKKLLQAILEKKERRDFNTFIDNLKYIELKAQSKESAKKAYKICPICGIKAYAGQHYCKVCHHKFS